MSELQFESILAAQSANIAAEINYIRTLQRANFDDDGGATYVRWTEPMAALALDQEGYSWFESADGAKWTLDNPEIRPEMFGAMGHATNDEGLAIRRMFEFASGRSVLITKVHRYKSLSNDEDIRIYSNTIVRGLSALTCGFRRIPNSISEMLVEPSFGVYWQDADNIEISDIFHDASRSGLGMPDEVNQRVNGFLTRGRCTRIRRNRLIAKNCTGYAFYNGAVDLDYCDDVVGTDCVAINCQVSFETTGPNEKSVEIRPDSRQFVDDGGIAVNYECGYHQYGGIAGAYYYQPKHRGAAPAVITAIVEDGLPNSSIIFDQCDFESNINNIASVIVVNDNYSTPGSPGNGILSSAHFVDGRIVNVSGPGTNFTAAKVDINGTTIIGRTATLSAGANSVVALRGNFDIRCTMPASTPNSLAAVAAVIAPSATCTRTPSGSITSTHLNGGAEVSVSGIMNAIKDTYFEPAYAGAATGTEAPRIRQRKKGFRVQGGSGTNDVIAAGNANGVFRYWSSIVFEAVPLDWNKVNVRLSLGDSNDIFTYPPPSSIKWVRRPSTAAGEVFVTIGSSAALPATTRLNFDIWEEV
jgi:hypothetical protein